MTGICRCIASKSQRLSGEFVLGPDQAVWALRITAKDRYSDRCWCWGERLDISLECAVYRPRRRWNGAMTPDVVREGQNDTLV
jgi:hypothetical protein